MLEIQYEIKSEWEHLTGGAGGTSTSRMKVFNGWIVRTTDYYTEGENMAISESSVFVPDLLHQWKIAP